MVFNFNPRKFEASINLVKTRNFEEPFKNMQSLIEGPIVMS